MSTITTQDVITLPQKLLHEFVTEFDKMKKIYEVIDHALAEKDMNDKNSKTFTDVDSFFDDLDNTKK
ncbi:MAG: hypothetical protein ACD_80C00174G0009 [uncultured bacterium (gcode 4)]|uniref:Uncharacterized protein n=1 Tax=uncultured bacterium (gcode 4) TaxID=1234023 RepID=K1YH65_9BACT|nr:MAG: hypothetical protein ACD_80C00174G0009 [uncultured bacterium (gcode 4)]HBB03874.1 hypothetical protein [Candidatus Gracilibacteria bacterium]